MKTISDLTKEQAIEIAKLLFPYIIVGEYEFRRSSGYNKTGNTEWYDYNDDCIIVNALYVDVHGQRRQLRCWILKNLDCRVDLFEPESGEIMRLPVRNQFVVQGRRNISYGVIFYSLPLWNTPSIKKNGNVGVVVIP